MIAPGAPLVERARQWIDGDPDPTTRQELARLVDAGDTLELEERFARPLTFGTAGLRGVVGAGPGRMNQAVVIRTTRALAEHLLAEVPDARTLPVVIGFDARLSSRAFAESASRVLSAAGIPVRYFDEPVPTPVVAFATRALAASAGIVVTASHNPGEYNGYKLYGANGVQIVPPFDTSIERRRETVPPANQIPLAEGPWGDASRVSPVPPTLSDRYLAEIDAARPRGDADRRIRIVYTALHGVGRPFVERALSAAGFSAVVPVAEQAEPDGTFPTVRFPNPEEEGALDLAIGLAERERADLVLANDPDADRLSVCVPTPAGRFIQLSGNQIGILLADFLVPQAPARPASLVLTTVVSSPMLAEFAAARGAVSELTLTGFKWLWTAALALEAAGEARFAFAYEEAIGFSPSRAVRDKDGIAAGLIFAEMAAQLHARKVSVLERLRSLYEAHGLWASAQHSIVRRGVEGVAQIEHAVERLVTSPPGTLGDARVERVTDYRKGAEGRPAWRGAAPLVVLDLAGQGRVVVRPSGTEPKLKIYVDLRGDAPRESFWEYERALQGKAVAVALELAGTLGLSG